MLNSVFPTSPRTILITGANGGLGQAIAASLLAEPETFVWLGTRHRRDRAEVMAAEHPGRCAVVSLDVTVEEDWEKAVASILEQSGQLDGLVNNAGHHEDYLLATMPASAWHSVIESNLHSVFLGCQAVVRPMMARRFGRIVNIASLSALLAPAGQTNYAAAKAGVLALTQSLAKEVARAGITVNALCPGYIETGALDAMSSEQKAATARSIPMRRLGQPAEVAAAARFLLSAEAGYITGSALKIDGGIF